MEKPPHTFAYPSMGTTWEISIWDNLPKDHIEKLKEEIIRRSTAFDETYSRFITSSLVWRMTKPGTYEVPKDLTSMLQTYFVLEKLSRGKVNPLVGFALRDLGYDETYSLKRKEVVRTVPRLSEGLKIIDDTHVEMKTTALLDLGALGKGYFVDRIADFLLENDVRRFLVNGSGDIFYRGNGVPLRAGLEHPEDPTKVIGVLEISDGAFCASAGNRRAWNGMHHTIDPDALTSSHDIAAVWVRAATAVTADGLCTCLMLTDPKLYASLPFEYCRMNRLHRIQRSPGFEATFY